ncbi:spore germination protein KA [Fontibacillus phaseoli]|uniref:Spore germination protein KA n=1 Tax=Fontibacillus phaseoli TaxID=1416533 RepID=A0A369BSN1_9BACL|nr:spore germination protein [Fontibacillus phaseoli]RCX23427.1 spore germination protein KA [Fontibacillus phaseoli]
MPQWRRPHRSARHGASASDQADSQSKSTAPATATETSSSKSLEDRLGWFQQQLHNCSDIIYRQFVLSTGQSCTLIYIRGMISQDSVQNFIIRSLQVEAEELKRRDIYQLLFEDKGLSVSQNKIINDLNDGLHAVLDAGVLLLIDGDERMMTFSISSYPTRSIDEAPNESVIRGPREAFIEDLEINLTLLRRRIKNKHLKTEAIILGVETKTDIVLTYIEGICKPELIKEIKRRLSYIEIDGVLGSSYIEEAIEDNPYSPFPQVQYSERPDVVAAGLLEGRFAIFVDGTPMTLIIPVTLPMLLQSAEDYYQRFVAATWIRWIRYFFVFNSLLLPSLYIAITTFHPEMIPAQFLRTIAASREIVPFPALLEAFIMELAFEALREASVRIPKSIGQAVSIIGALIIGTAAVEAGIVSAAMVIIVSLTGIASFIIPHFDLGLSFRLLRFPIMFLASMFGLYGIACGLIIIYIHLINLESFGIPYMSPVAPLVTTDLNDTLVRAPWYSMIKRPKQLTRKSTRQNNNSRGWAKVKGDES